MAENIKEAAQYALINLGETEEKREEFLQKMREWLEDNPKLHAKHDENSLLAFLRGCKFDLDKTKNKISNFYKMKTEMPEWFHNRDPNLPHIQQLIRLGVFVPLKDYYEGRLVVIIRTAAHDPKIYKQDDVFKAGKMVLDVAVKEHFLNASVYGVSAIFDMQGISFEHARNLPPHIIKKAVHAWQNYHCKPKQLEFVNAPLYINVVLNVFKSFMSEKLKGRVRVHFSGIQSLHNVVDKNILPKEYGGNKGTLTELTEYWLTKIIEHSEWFRDDEKYKADLS